MQSEPATVQDPVGCGEGPGRAHGTCRMVQLWLQQLQGCGGPQPCSWPGLTVPSPEPHGAAVTRLESIVRSVCTRVASGEEGPDIPGDICTWAEPGTFAGGVKVQGSCAGA